MHATVDIHQLTGGRCYVTARGNYLTALHETHGQFRQIKAVKYFSVLYIWRECEIDHRQEVDDITRRDDHTCIMCPML